MRLLRLTSLAAILLAWSALPLSAQFLETFETGTKDGYANGSITLSSGTWYFTQALLKPVGNTLPDLVRGARSVRMAKSGASIEMQFNSTNAGTVSFYYGAYGTDANNNRFGTIQLQKSTNNGSIWTNVGSPMTATGAFQFASFEVQESNPVRFRILQTAGGTPTGSNDHRVNIDDFRITEYIEVNQNPTITAEVNGTPTANGGNFAFNATAVGQSRTATLLLRNTGAADLTLSGASFQGDGFRLAESVAGRTVASLATTTVDIVFEPTALQTYQAQLFIASNDPATAEYAIVLNGPTFDAAVPITIAEARALPLGTNVTVSGWITVGNELGGPAYFQDNTGGIATFWTDLHTAVQTGDSVVVSGPLGEFGNSTGITGDGLRQISVPAGSGDAILFTVHPSGRQVQAPRKINLADLNSGAYEGQLVEIDGLSIHTLNATTPFTGAFQANTNYTVRDQAGRNAQLRIDNNVNLVGANAPAQRVSIIGVVGRFAGIYQLIPRSNQDLEAEVFVIPFEEVDRERTFEVVTWNIEWFGSTGNGPADENLQFANVKRVIETLDADLYALQEVSNMDTFRRLVDSLDAYRGFVAGYGQAQRVAYLYKWSVVDSLSSGFYTTSGEWGGGRWPFEFIFDATYGGITHRLRSIAFHAKAFATLTDWTDRRNDAIVLKDEIDSRHLNQKVIILGDFNDDVVGSIVAGQQSPYQNFVNDPNYSVITKSLSERGQTSYSSLSNIDHIMITAPLNEAWLEGTERIENPFYIGNYLSTTSDHFPVWTRFALTPLETSTEDFGSGAAEKIRLNPAYPNPFNPATVLRYQLSAFGQTRLSVYDLLGREVAVLVDGVMPAGSHAVQFDGAGLSSGIYLVRLQAAGQVRTTMVTLLK